MAAIRRLAAILAADVAGYSRLMGADEGGTLRALKLVRADLVDPEIAEHNGRLVKTTGDGLLVEFSSVVDALRCATEVQRGMVERNTLPPMDNRIGFRIGAKLRAAGKTGKQALVACMRKLVVILNAILRDRKPWQPA
jgi:adenylate cyclase